MVSHAILARQIKDLERLHSDLTESRDSTERMIGAHALEGVTAVLDDMRRALQLMETTIQGLRGQAAEHENEH